MIDLKAAINVTESATKGKQISTLMKNAPKNTSDLQLVILQDIADAVLTIRI